MKSKWHHKRNCHKHNCNCVVTYTADSKTGIAGCMVGQKIVVHHDDRCKCGPPNYR